MDEIMFAVKNNVHIQELWMKLVKGQNMIGIPKMIVSLHSLEPLV